MPTLIDEQQVLFPLVKQGVRRLVLESAPGFNAALSLLELPALFTRNLLGKLVASAGLDICAAEECLHRP